MTKEPAVNNITKSPKYKVITLLSNRVFASYHLIIYDRWGDLIFETKDDQVPWDGRANDGKEIAQQDVFIWMILALDDQAKRHQYIGHVTLIR